MSPRPGKRAIPSSEGGKRLVAWLDSQPAGAMATIADRCGVSERTVRRWITGDVAITVAAASQISDIAGVSVWAWAWVFEAPE